MNKRDLLFATAGLVLTVGGIGALIYRALTLALIVMFLLLALLLGLLILQRRQLGAVQERNLRILRAQTQSLSQFQKNEKLRSAPRQKDNTEITTKKILDLLNAQQVSMELLNTRIEDIVRKIEHER